MFWLWNVSANYYLQTHSTAIVISCDIIIIDIVDIIILLDLETDKRAAN